MFYYALELPYETTNISLVRLGDIDGGGELKEQVPLKGRWSKYLSISVNLGPGVLAQDFFL